MKKAECAPNRDSTPSPYQHFLVMAEQRFWRCVHTGDIPRPDSVEPPRPRIEAVRIVDMSESNLWAEFAGLLSPPLRFPRP